MIKRRKMQLNGEWRLLAGNRVYELNPKVNENCFVYKIIYVTQVKYSQHFRTIF
jgi:hypothetical protein